MSAAYRFNQGMRALAARLQPVQDDEARAMLDPPLYELYRRMRRAERQHSLRVLRALGRAGYDEPDLLAAALLHDVGKTRARFSLPEKVIVVLVKAARPDLYRRWGSGPADGWRQPFAVSVQHPSWGADLVAAAGGSPRTVELIRRHADPVRPPFRGETDRLLAALQAVDDAS